MSPNLQGKAIRLWHTCTSTLGSQSANTDIEEGEGGITGEEEEAEELVEENTPSKPVEPGILIWNTNQY